MNNSQRSFWLWAVVIFATANAGFCLYVLATSHFSVIASVASVKAMSGLGVWHVFQFLAKPVAFAALAVLVFVRNSYAILAASALLLNKVIEFTETFAAMPSFFAMPEMMRAVFIGYWVGAVGVLAVIIAYLTNIRNYGAVHE